MPDMTGMFGRTGYGSRGSTRSFDLDHKAIERAAALLGLGGRVAVSIVRYSRDTNARYVGRRDDRISVSVSRDMSADEVSRAIWHELTHARQAEQLGSDAALAAQWSQEMRRAGLSAVKASGQSMLWPWEQESYDNTPLEREAVANERRHADLPLAVPR